MSTPLGYSPPDLLFEAQATLAAEPRILRAWAAATNHPRLADAYRALAERVTARLAPPPAADVARWERATEAYYEAALKVEPELSRLKRLASSRRNRLMLEAIPDDAPERAADALELAAIEALIADLARRIC